MYVCMQHNFVSRKRKMKNKKAITSHAIAWKSPKDARQNKPVITRQTLYDLLTQASSQTYRNRTLRQILEGSDPGKNLRFLAITAL